MLCQHQFYSFAVFIIKCRDQNDHCLCFIAHPIRIKRPVFIAHAIKIKRPDSVTVQKMHYAFVLLSISVHISVYVSISVYAKICAYLCMCVHFFVYV